MTRSRRATGLVAAALALSLLAAACGSSKKSDTSSNTTAAGTATTAGGSGGTGGTRDKLVIGETLAPPTLDITTGSGAAIPQALLTNVYETLVKIDDAGKIQPLLAKDFKVSDDGLTYTFTLQDNVKFQNGEAFSSKDVQFTYDNAQKNITAGKAPAIISQTWAPVASIDSSDPKAVVIKLKQRSRDFLFNLSQTGGAIVNEKAIADVATKPVGTGPYSFVSYTTNANLKLTRNDAYWGAKPAIKDVEFRYFSDAKALADAIKTPDGIDIIDNLTPELFKPFTSDSNYQTVQDVTSGETILAMNNSKAPLSDVKVRQAIYYAIDRKAVNDIAESGYGKLIGSHSSPNDPWYKDLSNTYPYDPNKAKSLLKEAGQSNIKLTLDVPPVPYAKSSAQVIKDQLGQVGIDVTLNDIEFPLWIDKVFTKADYDLTIISHVEARDTALYGNPKYYWRYDNPKVQDLLKQADAAPTEDESNKLYGQVLDQINADAVNVWLFLLPRLEVVKKGITGFPQRSFSLAYDVTGIK